MSKNPWICSACTSTVSSRLTPAPAIMLAHQLRRDRRPRRARPPVLARVAEIRHHRRDARRRGAPARVRHHQQLHQLVVRRRAGRLHDEDVAPAHVLHQLDVHLAVAEAAHRGAPERHRADDAQSPGQARGSRCPKTAPSKIVPRQFLSTRVYPAVVPDLAFTSRLPPRDWLGWKDSNLRMAGSKPAALPLGDTPTALKLTRCRPRPPSAPPGDPATASDCAHGPRSPPIGLATRPAPRARAPRSPLRRTHRIPYR